MIGRFFGTIVISVLLGIFLGSLAYHLSTFLNPPQTSLLQTQPDQSILLTDEQPLAQSPEPYLSDSIKSESIPLPPVERTQPTPEPTPLPSVTEEPTPTPSAIPSPSPTDEPTSLATPSSSPALTQTGLKAGVLFDLINQHRSKLGLPSFEKEDKICALAQSRAPQLEAEFASGRLHSGFYNKHLPYRASENVIQMKTEEQALNWWLHSPVHRAAIEGDYQYSCISCSGSSCSEVFTSFSPKSGLKSVETASKIQ